LPIFVGKELRTEKLVQRIVPADVLAQAKQLSGGIEQRRGVQAARAVEDGLGGPERLGQAVNDIGLDDRPAEPGTTV
jgi:hypothetical protein